MILGTTPNQPNCPVLISVSNLPADVTEKQIWEVFGPFGAVTNVQITLNEPENDQFNIRSAVATVTMPIYNEALCAMMSINQNEVCLVDIENSTPLAALFTKNRLIIPCLRLRL